MINNPHMLPKLRAPAISRAIRGRMPCALRLAGFIGESCASGHTVCGCHLPVMGKGTATKVTDLAVVAGCHVCHDLLDGRDSRGLGLREAYPLAYQERLLLALVETHARLLADGVLSVTGGRVI